MPGQSGLLYHSISNLTALGRTTMRSRYRDQLMGPTGPALHHIAMGRVRGTRAAARVKRCSGQLQNGTDCVATFTELLMAKFARSLESRIQRNTEELS